MADKRITELTSAGTLHLDDLLVYVDVHDTTMAATGTDKKLVFAALMAAHTGDVTYTGFAGTIAAGAVTEGKMALADVTALDVATTRHGFAPKLPNDATKFLNGIGTYTVPAGGGGGGTITLTGDTTGSGTASIVTTTSKIGGQAVALGGSLTFTGGFSTVIAVTGNTNITLPTSGTLLTSNQTITLTGDTTGSGATSITTATTHIGGQAVSLAGPFTTSGAFSTTLTVTGNTSVTLPTSGTLLTSNQTITLTGDTTGSGTTAITTTTSKISGQAVSLGGALTFSGAFSTTVTVSGITSVTLPTSGTLLSTSTPVTIPQGGTGQITAAAAFNALSPLTTLGDMIYASGANTAARLAGSTTTLKRFLTQIGSGAASNPPAWTSIATADLPQVMVSGGGTGLTTLTAHAVILGEGTSAVSFATVGTAGALLMDHGGSADPSFVAMSGDATITTAGVLNVTKTGGVSFSTSATTDATNATNITSGTLPAAQLPVFIASGVSHAKGAVPDPGAVAGTVNFLREDATWAVPAGGGGGGASLGLMSAFASKNIFM